MSFKTIFFAMFLVLVGLFIYSYFFRKKELGLSRVEADYFNMIKEYRNSPESVDKNKLKELAIQYGMLKGLAPQEIEIMISKDIPNL